MELQKEKARLQAIEERVILRCVSCFSGTFDLSTHICKIPSIQEARTNKYNDLYPVEGLIMSSCRRCDGDIIIEFERRKESFGRFCLACETYIKNEKLKKRKNTAK